MAKARRLARKSGLNRPAIGFAIRRGALRVSPQSTIALQELLDRSESKGFGAAQGSCRMGGQFQACEMPNRPPMLSPATKE